MALILVLWIVVILSAVALQLKFATHLRMKVTANATDSAKAFYLAKAGVERTIAEVLESQYEVQSQADLREDLDRLYHNVELGEGTYTLFVGMDENGDPIYGIDDEASRLNVNTVASAVLDKLPNIMPGVASAIESKRKRKPFNDLNDLLMIEGVDEMVLYGEDQNQNGILDANENDANQSWPPDNADGELDRGLAEWLTVWSAAKDVTANGDSRTNINEADADTIESSLPGLSSQQAESIVEHRKKNKFSSVFDLLDVELVEKVQQQTKPGGNNNNKQPRGQSQDKPKPGRGDGSKPSSNNNSGRNNAKPSSGKPASNGKNPESNKDKQKPDKNKEGKTQTVMKSTGEKAFDTDSFKKIADLVTVREEEVIKGIVNINTASREVLACLPNLDEQVADSIVRERQENPEGFSTIVDVLSVEGVTIDLLKKLAPHISVRTDVFSARSFGVVANGDTYRCVSAVIDRTEDEVRILYWHEHD